MLASLSIAKPRVIFLEGTEAIVGWDQLFQIMTRFVDDGIACVHYRERRQKISPMTPS